MPKMKTKSAAKKRFRVTGSGKVKFKQAFSRHMMMNKSKSMKRKARGMEVLNESDTATILENFLPYDLSKAKKSKNPSPAERKAAKEAANENSGAKAPAKKAVAKKAAAPKAEKAATAKEPAKKTAAKKTAAKGE